MSAGSALVLASTSPRRAALLAAAGFAFEVEDPGVDEESFAPEVRSPSRRAVLLALAKARAVAVRRPGRVVLGADTLVVLGERDLGKPHDADRALWMLSRLSGTDHEVITGVALVAPGGRERTSFAATRVAFDRWPASALAAYAHSGAPVDKAGGYGIQEGAGAFVREIAGCYFNVVGLPVPLVARLLAELRGAP